MKNVIDINVSNNWQGICLNALLIYDCSLPIHPVFIFLASIGKSSFCYLQSLSFRAESIIESSLPKPLQLRWEQRIHYFAYT